MNRSRLTSNPAPIAGDWPTLYVPLSRGRVLSVVGTCPMATRFALTAIKQLD